jgi:hypothetical protein
MPGARLALVLTVLFPTVLWPLAAVAAVRAARRR